MFDDVWFGGVFWSLCVSECVCVCAWSVCACVCVCVVSVCSVGVLPVTELNCKFSGTVPPPPPPPIQLGLQDLYGKSPFHVSEVKNVEFFPQMTRRDVYHYIRRAMGQYFLFAIGKFSIQAMGIRLFF